MLLAGLAYAASTGFGVLKTVAIVGLLGLLVVSLIDRRFYWPPRLMVGTVTTYAMLVVADTAMLLMIPRVNGSLSVQGMHAKDDKLGYGLTPGWKGTYDDGVVRNARHTINDQGHRDRPPVDEAANRILLLGDSFTFGNLLDDEDTIDRQIEKQSSGRVDAYNLGVPGYGAPAALEMLRRNPLKAFHVVYLFYENDLRNDGLESEGNTVRRGFLVARLDDKGREMSDAELDRNIDEEISRPSTLFEILRLRNINAAVYRALHRRRASNAELQKLGDSPLDYRESNVDAVLGFTQQMQALARDREAGFSALIIPSLAEVNLGRHFDLVQTYVAALKNAGITVLTPMEHFSTEDYYAHDGHFSPDGASKAAGAILEPLGSGN